MNGLLSWLKYGRLCLRCDEERTYRHFVDELCTTCHAVDRIRAALDEILQDLDGEGHVR